jgi:hypothetical protein
MHQDPSSQEYADEVARLRASESDSDAELLVCLDMFSLYSTYHERAWSGENWIGIEAFPLFRGLFMLFI